MSQKALTLSVFGALVWVAIILTGISLIGKDPPAAPEPAVVHPDGGTLDGGATTDDDDWWIYVVLMSG